MTLHCSGRRPSCAVTPTNPLGTFHTEAHPIQCICLRDLHGPDHDDVADTTTIGNPNTLLFKRSPNSWATNSIAFSACALQHDAPGCMHDIDPPPRADSNVLDSVHDSESNTASPTGSVLDEHISLLSGLQILDAAAIAVEQAHALPVPHLKVARRKRFPTLASLNSPSSTQYTQRGKIVKRSQQIQCDHILHAGHATNKRKRSFFADHVTKPQDNDCTAQQHLPSALAKYCYLPCTATDAVTLTFELYQHLYALASNPHTSAIHVSREDD